MKNRVLTQIKIKKYNSKEIDARVMEAAEILKIDDLLNRKPKELSGGQRQRVTIARALGNEPAIIWADEPTGDLDSETAQGIMDLLFELNERNKQTFIIVTHSQEIGDQCNRIVKMRDGLVVDDGVDAV